VSGEVFVMPALAGIQFLAFAGMTRQAKGI
jgi:hypothetical protein